MIEVKRFGGAMNLDDNETDTLPPQHISANNICFRGGGNGLSAVNIKGNFLINNSDLPNGTNECAGAFYDSVKHRILWFNYNSNNNHGLYQLLVQTGQVSKIFLCGTDSASDILELNLNYPVHSMALVYRTEGDGDLLYWTDGNNPPRFLNLDTVSTYAPFTEDMLNAAKNAPTRPPGSLSFQDDVTTSFNAVRNKQFRFAYRWVYANGEKSTFSPISITPVTYALDPNAEPDPTVDNYIQFDVYSADTIDSTAIEVFMQIWEGSKWGDFQRIDLLERDQYGIAVASTYTYKFYNNGSYVFIDPQESELYFTYLPQKANTLEALNGNVIIYGGITEGYPSLQREDVDVTVTSSLVAATGLAIQAWDWAADQRLGIVYVDAVGRTSGVISFLTDSAIDTTDFAVTTPQYTGATPLGSFGTVPQIAATINHTPPTWAVAYYWVRVNLTPQFTYTVTMDLQSDATYWYLGIQNLIEMNGNNGFLPSYEFNEGDRVRVIANWGGNGLSTSFSTQQDYPILAVVDKIMTSPATTGKFIKIPKLASSSPAYTNKMLIKLYTPLERVPANKQLFFEWSQRYAIYESAGIRYHRGQLQDQTAIQPATFAWTDGDVYAKYRGIYTVIPFVTLNYLYMMDSRWNDYVPTAGNSNGRGWVIEEKAATVYNSVGVRWGGKYQSGTTINQLNIFRPNDFDEADREKGDIRRFKTRERILRIFQDRGVGRHGVYARFIQNNSGVPELVTTNEIITVNNIQYYQGQYGLCGYPTNLCSSTIADYFNDVVTGREVRLSGDGITDLGLLYKGEFYLSGLVVPYNKELSRANGSSSKVMKYWDTFENQSHTVLQGGGIIPAPPFPGRLIFAFNESMSSTEWGLAFFGAGAAGDKVTLTLNNGSVTEVYVYTCSQGDTVFTVRNALIALINVSAIFSASTAIHGAWQGLDIEILGGTLDVVGVITYGMNEQVSAFNYSFNEKRNAFCSFYDFIPEWAISADNMVYTFKDGQIYKHDNQLYYCNFYNENFGCHVTVVFNQNLLQKKSWQSITEIASDTWSVPILWTNVEDFAGQRQQSNLVAAEFVKQEQNPTASIKRSTLSRGGKISGSSIKGNWLAIKFQKDNAQYEISLSEISVAFVDSPLTRK